MYGGLVFGLMLIAPFAKEDVLAARREAPLIVVHGPAAMMLGNGRHDDILG
jgi:glucosamine 6-phosphate synthetase-like amidotransferase/phosphosugar isomerase protein